MTIKHDKESSNRRGNDLGINVNIFVKVDNLLDVSLLELDPFSEPACSTALESLLDCFGFRVSGCGFRIEG